MILNCLCKQCKLANKRNSTYKMVNKRVRRSVNRAIKHNVDRKVFDFDVPTKFKGEYAA